MLVESQGLAVRLCGGAGTRLCRDAWEKGFSFLIQRSPLCGAEFLNSISEN